MTRVAVSGAHGVGKTTLLDALRDRAGNRIHLVGNVIRGIAAEGYPVGSSTVPETLAVYLERQQNQERAAPCGVHVVSDRILADGLAYVLAAIDIGVAKYPWAPGELRLLDAAARLHASRFDYHVFLPAEFPLSPGNPLHMHGPAFQLAVETRLRMLVADNWPVPVVEVRGSVDDRVEAIVALLKPDLDDQLSYG